MINFDGTIKERLMKIRDISVFKAALSVINSVFILYSDLACMLDNKSASLRDSKMNKFMDTGLFTIYKNKEDSDIVALSESFIPELYKCGECKFRGIRKLRDVKIDSCKLKSAVCAYRSGQRLRNFYLMMEKDGWEGHQYKRVEPLKCKSAPIRYKTVHMWSESDYKNYVNSRLSEIDIKPVNNGFYRCVVILRATFDKVFNKNVKHMMYLYMKHVFDKFSDELLINQNIETTLLDKHRLESFCKTMNEDIGMCNIHDIYCVYWRSGKCKVGMMGCSEKIRDQMRKKYN